MIQAPDGTNADDIAVYNGEQLVMQTPLTAGESARIKSGTFDRNTGVLTLLLDGDRLIQIDGLPTTESIGTGRKGDRGATGDAGTNGSNGKNGRAGDQGCRGPKGNRGVMGNTGATGATGSDGLRGPTGAAGATGAAGGAGKDGVPSSLSCTSYGGIEYTYQTGLTKQWGRHKEAASLSINVLFGKAFEGDPKRLNLQITFLNMVSEQASSYKIVSLNSGGFTLAVDKEPSVNSHWDFYWSATGDDGMICGVGSGDPDFDGDNSLEYNAPDIQIFDSSIAEPVLTRLREMPFEVCLSEPLVGSDLTVEYSTVSDKAIGMATNIDYLAFDIQENPFIAVLDEPDYRVVMDAGQSRYKNNTIDNGALEGTKAYTENVLKWLNLRNSKRILLVGDTFGDNGVFSMDDSTNGFGYTFSSIVSGMAGYNITSIPAQDLPTDIADYDEYGVIIYVATMLYDVTTGVSSNIAEASSISDSSVTALTSAIEGGLGAFLITGYGDEEGYTMHKDINKVTRPLGAEFIGKVDRVSVSIDTIVGKYGAHPLWNGVTGTIYGSNDEGWIQPYDFEGDFQTKVGTLTFAEGETCRNIYVTIAGDAEVDPNETFSVVLTNASRGSITKSTATGTIEED